MRLIITLLLGCLLWQPALAAPVPTENQLKQELKQAESSKNAPNQAETSEALQSALNWLTERKRVADSLRAVSEGDRRFP